MADKGVLNGALLSCRRLVISGRSAASWGPPSTLVPRATVVVQGLTPEYWTAQRGISRALSAAPFTVAGACGSISDRVTTRDGVPVANAEVRLLDRVDGALAGRTTTDTDGRYSFGGVPLGRDFVVIVLPDRRLVSAGVVDRVTAS